MCPVWRSSHLGGSLSRRQPIVSQQGGGGGEGEGRGGGGRGRSRRFLRLVASGETRRPQSLFLPSKQKFNQTRTLSFVPVFWVPCRGQCGRRQSHWVTNKQTNKTSIIATCSVHEEILQLLHTQVVVQKAEAATSLVSTTVSHKIEAIFLRFRQSGTTREVSRELRLLLLLFFKRMFAVKNGYNG